MYQIQANETLGEGTRRIAREQVEAALTGLREGADRNEGIHEARKSCKKLRALLRLLRTALDEESYRDQNQAYRDAARLLSAVRDRWVLVETLDSLAERYGEWLSPAACAPVRARLVERHQVALESSLGVEGADRRAAAAIERAWLAFERLRPELVPEAAVAAAGVRGVYRRGRRAFVRAERKPTTARVHEVRKQVKYLWYAARLLGGRVSEGVLTQTERLERLSRLLGEEHDLAVLGVELRNPGATRSLEQRLVLLGLVGERRAELRRSASALARRLYAPRPSDVAAQIERDWRPAGGGQEEPASSRSGGRDAVLAPGGSGRSVARFDPARRRRASL
jgi:CHAD domain-containing protein